MLEKAYGTLLFDIDGTLLDYAGAQRHAALAALAAHAPGATADLVQRVMTLVEGEEVQDVESCRPGLMETGSPEMQAVFDRAGVLLPPAPFLEAYFDAMAEHGVALRDIPGMLAALAPGRTLGVVSNGRGPVQRSRLALAGLMEHLGVLVVSCEVGTAKPDPEILRLAMRLAGSDPRSTLFVGDSVSSDMGAAAAAGVDFVYIDPEGRFPAAGPRVLELRSAAELTVHLGLPEVDRGGRSS